MSKCIEYENLELDKKYNFHINGESIGANPHELVYIHDNFKIFVDAEGDSVERLPSFIRTVYTEYKPQSDYIEFKDVKVGDVLEKVEAELVDLSPYEVAEIRERTNEIIIKTKNKVGAIHCWDSEEWEKDCKWQKINEEKPMSDYIKFEDLKVGEKYENYMGNSKGDIFECECELSQGEKVMRCVERKDGFFILCGSKSGTLLKLHKPKPLLTEESIGKWYEDNEGDKFKMHGKIEVEGDICFVGMPKCYKSHATLFLENGKARCNQASDWFLIKEVK